MCLNLQPLARFTDCMGAHGVQMGVVCRSSLLIFLNLHTPTLVRGIFFLSRSVPHTGDTRDKDVGEIRGASDISLRAIKELQGERV